MTIVSTDLTVSNSSPFDSIRHFDQDGNEFWTGRELMGLFGYSTWQKFQNPLIAASENVEAAGEVLSAHILSVGLSRKQDIRLSRFGAYHVALACDSRNNPSVKAAKQYFVVKTREAELVIPAQNDRLRELELEIRLMELRDKAAVRQDYRIAIHGLATTLLLEGKSDTVIEIDREISTVIDPRSNSSYSGQTLPEIVKHVSKMTGKKFASGADLERHLEQQNESGLIATRPITIAHKYVPVENLDKVYAALKLGDQQALL